MFPSPLKSMFMLALCTITLSRPFNAPPIVNIWPRDYSPNDPDLPPAIQAVCNGSNVTSVVASSAFGTGGVVLTQGACAPANIAVESIDSIENVSSPERPSCVSAPNNCATRFGSQFSGNGYVGKCGAPCTSACYPGTNGPNPNDCQNIINQLYTQSSQLFTLNANNFLLLSYQTCGIGFQNQIAASSIGCSQTILYDYSDFAAVAQYLAWNCQAAQNARGGACEANSGVYQATVPDFYVQVYQNS